jgi:hypothetical protein
MIRRNLLVALGIGAVVVGGLGAGPSPSQDQAPTITVYKSPG